MDETKKLQQYNTHYSAVKLLMHFAVVNGFTVQSSILDPSCGSGSILLGAITQKIKMGATLDEALNFTGIDISELVLSTARKNITEALFSFYPEEDKEYISIRVQENLLCADFLSVHGEQYVYDFVIMNPPFSATDDVNITKGRPIYYDHVRKGFFHARQKLVCIIPARWYMAGRNANAFKPFMMSGKISTIIDFSGDISLFVDNINIVGGVCITVLDKQARHREALVLNVKDGVTTSTTHRPMNEFGDHFVRDNEIASWLRGVNASGQGTRSRVSSRVTTHNCFDMVTIPSESGNTVCYTTGDKWTPHFIYHKEPWRTQDIEPDTYNIMITRVGFYRDNIKRAFVSNPGDICTSKVLCIRGYTSKEKTEQLLEYLQSQSIISLCDSCQTALGLNEALFSLIPDLIEE